MADRKKDIFYKAMTEFEKENYRLDLEDCELSTYFFDYAYDKQQEKIQTLQQEVKKLTELIELLPEG